MNSKIWALVFCVLLVTTILLVLLSRKKKECMETRKVIDCFTFFNELDILEKRLRYMNSYVDYFIISEAPNTFSGNEKPFYFEENKDRFSEWKDKIIYIKTKPLGEGFWDREKYGHLITYGGGRSGFWEKWEREGQQRFAIEEELKKFNDNDIIIFSDVDEFPDMTKVDVNNIGDEIYVCKQRIFRYSFDYMVDTTEFDWHGTTISSNKTTQKEGLIHIRAVKDSYKSIEKCGWHMTKFGSVENALMILENYSHSGEHDYSKHTKNKTSWETGKPLINTPQEIKDTIPKELL